MHQSGVKQFLFLLTGLQNRLTQRREYCVAIDVDLLTGAKKWTIHAKIEDQNWAFSYLGDPYKVPIDGFGTFLQPLLPQYDRVVFTYHERGRSYRIEAEGKQAKMTTPDTQTQPMKTDASKTRRNMIRIDQAQPLLQALAITDEQGKLKNDKIRKFRQLDTFIELIDTRFENMMRQKEELHVVDAACGKSYLSFALNHHIVHTRKKRCTIIGLDQDAHVIDQSKKIAKKLSYRNMDFLRTDLASYEREHPIDLLISLHACDTATDYAIALGINRGAHGIIAVPCCHQQLQSQIKHHTLAPMFSHRLLKARMTDMLTDGLRALLLQACGYDVEIFEYVSPLETPKNMMILAKKTGSFSPSAYASYKTIRSEFSVQPILESRINNEILARVIQMHD